MHYANTLNFHTIIMVVVYLINSRTVLGQKPMNLKEYIATDRNQDDSSVEDDSKDESMEDDSKDESMEDDSKDESMEDSSREEMIEILHNGQYFQDIFMEHLAPLKYQFGHVCEDPHEWQQRFEENDFDANRFQGKVRWGNAHGDYGEHYWDLGHAGRK